jgi:hypothetical protein
VLTSYSHPVPNLDSDDRIISAADAQGDSSEFGRESAFMARQAGLVRLAVFRGFPAGFFHPVVAKEHGLNILLTLFQIATMLDA